MNGSEIEIDTDVDESDHWTDGSNDSEDNTDEGLFDDADDDNDQLATTREEVDGKENRTHRKRNRKSPPNIFFDWGRAIKRRRQRQEELERQRDLGQFDDDDNDNDNKDPIQNSGTSVYGTSQSSFSPHSKTAEKGGIVSVDGEEVIRATKEEKATNAGNSTVTGRSLTIAMTFEGGNTFDKPSAKRTRVADEEENKIIEDTATAVGISRDISNVDGTPFEHHKIHSNRKDSRSKSYENNPEHKSRNKYNNSNSSLSSNYFKFEERKFFSSPTFKPEIKEEAFRRIYTAIETPLKVLEDHGYEAYRQYIEGYDEETDHHDRDNKDASGRIRGGRNRKNYRGLFRNIKIKNSYRDKQKDKEESIRNSLRNALVNGDPREYQRTIFEVARQRNTIVNLGTGAGKTLIALLLIRDIWSTQSTIEARKMTDGIKDNEIRNNKQSRTTDKKQTLFLVPSVALAIQQSLTLRANLPHLNVETACYTSASSKRTRALLGSCDVIVATHGVIQDLLMHYGDTFRMDRFNLVVIDECHYAASGNHTYRHLMTKFYHPLEPQRRPRVLGLTASPLLNVKESHSDEQLSIMLDKLEKTLDSKMVSAAGLIGSREKEDPAAKSVALISTPSNNNLLHRVIDERALNYHGTNMHRTIPSADNLELLPSRYRELKQLENLYKDLGPLVLTIYCAILRRELSKNIFENESMLQFDCTMDHLRRIEEFCNQEIKILPNMGRNDKILALEELIEKLVEEKGGMKAIGLVFVERRITAIALHSYFLWRNRQILVETSAGLSSNWKFAKQARRETHKSDSFFELKSSRNKVDQDDYEDDQFDDSVDDPFRIFQQRNETQDDISVMKKHFQGEMKETNSDLFPTAQFMNAESDSEDETDNPARENTKIDFRYRLGRALVKSVALVRNPVQIFNSLSITQKNFKESEKEEQCQNWVHRESNVRDVLNKLRRGDMNLMFATSVVEEGVDVQACSFVVAFDGLTNIKGYIQMKGRARKQDAKFFVFRDPHDSRRSKLDLCVAQKMESRIQRFIEERMRIYAPRIHAISSHDENIEFAAALPKEIAAIEAGAYKVGDATVDIQSAKSLLNRYFLSIPLDPFVRCKKESLLAYMPCFESNCLVLPVHLPNDIRTVVLPAKYTDFPRREKQKLLSLMACVRLHCYGLLNERLLPLTRKDMQCRILHVATQKLEKIETVPLDLGCFYNDNRRHFMVYPFNQKSLLLSKYCDRLNGEGHTLGLITTTPIKSIESFQMYHAEFGKVDISIGESMFISCSTREYDILQQTFLLLINSRWSRKSRNIFYQTRAQDQYDAVIPPYLVGILSSNGELDWDFMNELVEESKRCIEERTLAAQNVSSTVHLPKPRICCTSYNRFLPYVVYGPTGESCGTRVPFEMKDVETYCEYFQKIHSLEFSTDCPLLRAHRIWSLPSGLPTKPRSRGSESDLENVSFDLVEIPQQAFIEEPLANAYVASLCLFLPQVLFTFERQQKTEAFIQHCEAHIPTLGCCFRKMDFSRVALAVTSKSCNPDENYDGWEWVGDAVLKLLQTDSILKSAKLKHFVKFLHEGDLSMLRSSMGTNERLRQICTHLCLENYIMMTSLARGKWTPSPLQIIRTVDAKVKDAAVQRIKILADVIESILGVVYLEFGYHVSMKVGNELHVTLPWDETDTSVACGDSGDIENSVLLDVVQKCTGHSKTFSRPKLVSEAFTHPSAIDALVPSYQRLEWIGDAVLCLCAREWLFRNLGEETNLGELVVSEGAIVSNETLGFVSMKFGLQEYLNHRDQSLPKRIESYCWNIQEGCGLWGGDPPKPIADMVEAILGAIHVSSGFESGQAGTKHLMSSVFSVFKQASSEGTSGLTTFLKTMKHPKKSLQEMTGQLLNVIVCSENDFATSYNDDDDDDKLDDISIMKSSIPQILHKDEWRNPAHGRGSDSSQVAFVSILGHPLVAVADESINVARNRASSLVREAIERNPELENRIAKCRSKVESGLTLAARR